MIFMAAFYRNMPEVSSDVFIRSIVLLT